MPQPPETDPLVLKAKEFAFAAHAGQTRFNRERYPYTTHLQKVAALTAAAGGTVTEIAAAWLHDTVEDTPTTIEDIEREFGKEVAEIVSTLTDPPEFEQLSWEERKASQARHIQNQNVSVQKVKLADQTENVEFIGTVEQIDWDIPMRRTYVEGAKKVAEGCKDSNPRLYEQFMDAYNRAILTLYGKN